MNYQEKVGFKVGQSVTVVKDNGGWFLKNRSFIIGRISEFNNKVIIFPDETLKEWGYNCTIDRIR